MAYAAVTSLKQTIHLLLDSPRTSPTSSTLKILKSARWAAKRLLCTLKQYDKIKSSSQGLLAVDARIRDEARNLEDQIESHASARFLSQSQTHDYRFSLDLDHLTNHIHCFVKTARKMETEYMDQIHKNPHPPQQVSAAAVSSSSTTTTGDSDERIVSLDSYLEIRDDIVEESHNAGFRACGITGMAGIGKTTFVKKLFTDSVVKETFECRAFVTLGQKKYDFKEILRAIVAQLNVDHTMRVMRGDENIYQYFMRSLSGRKFLIVLDDLWSCDGNFERRLEGLLADDDENCNGTLLVTSRNEISVMIGYSMASYMVQLLNEEESWELLQLKVFGEGCCPPQLVKPGKKIAENCDGLPLLIVTVAEHLLRSPINLEYWNEVAEMKNNSLFEDAIDEIYEVLLPSYRYLDQNLKACFLYMGVFPKNYVVRKSRITHLWRAERFSYLFDSILDDLVSTNLVVIRERRFSSIKEAKGCNLHVVYRHLSKKEGENDKFISILDSYVEDGSIEHRMKDKRHLAIYHNTLLAMKEVYDSIASLSTLCSLLCTGPYHQYQVPVCLELALLRVLDALTIRFYEFPIEVVKLIHLSRVIRAYGDMEIARIGASSNRRKKLTSSSPGIILPNLTQLLDVGAQTCVKGVVESLPKLEKLRVQIELVPHAAVQPQTMNSFDHISCLKRLGSLQSVIINPYLLHSIPPRLSSECFESMNRISKLSLSGFGYPWEDMSEIAKLPTLEGLKLKGYAFRGEKWEAEEMRFLYLCDLVIEDTNLEHWTAIAESFPKLRNITLENCHKLKEIPTMRDYTNIKLVDCNPIAEGWEAGQLAKSNVYVHHSWE